jgi:D-alanine transaminase
VIAMTDTPLVYLNGQFLPMAEARVPVMDRGFLFGDSVYEVIPVYGGRLFRLAHHLDRLDNSLAAIEMANPIAREEWKALLGRLVGQRPGEDQSVYLQVTRGPADKRDHAIPPVISPTVFAMTNPLLPIDAAVAAEGIAAITLPDLRWLRCDIKATTLLANVLARQRAKEHGAVEAILLRDGLALEGAASNLFVVKEGLLVTPPKSVNVLPGITRDLVLELAAANGIPHAEAAIPESDLGVADEILLTSSTREVMPVSRLDGRPVGSGRPGALWRRIDGLYQAYKARVRQGADG